MREQFRKESPMISLVSLGGGGTGLALGGASGSLYPADTFWISVASRGNWDNEYTEKLDWDNEGKIYELGGPKIISFGEMVKSILRTINKKRFVIEMPMPIAKIQSSITDLLPLPPILTRDQCKILSEPDNIVTNDHLSLKDLDINPTDVEEAMEKWLWRFKSGGQFAKKNS